MQQQCSQRILFTRRLDPLTGCFMSKATKPSQSNPLATITSFFVIAGVVAGFFYWWLGPRNPDSDVSISGKNVAAAGRDAVVGHAGSTKDRDNASTPTTPPKIDEIEATGDVAVGGRDAIINNYEERKLHDVVETDGAGGFLIAKPDVGLRTKAVLSVVNGSSAPASFVGLIPNFTEVMILDSTSTPPWTFIRVVEGEFKDKEGWVFSSSLGKR